MAHTCSSLLIKCMDFRLTKDVYDWLERKQLVNDCDMVSVAGAAKDIVENPDGFVFSLVKLSRELHQVNRVILIQHLDCGAYGGCAAFPREAEERAKHQEQLAKARAVIVAKLPELQVEGYIASREGAGWRIDPV